MVEGYRSVYRAQQASGTIYRNIYIVRVTG